MTFFLFLLKTYIVGTRLNLLAEVVLMSIYKLRFGAKIRKNRYTPAYPSFAISTWDIRISNYTEMLSN